MISRHDIRTRTLAGALLACLAAPPAGAQLRPVPRPESLPPLIAERPLPRPEAAADADGDLAGGGDAARNAGWPDREGPLCGIASVRGDRVESVEGAGECGIVRPVRAKAVAGVALEPAPVLACPAIEALAEWLEESAKPAFVAQGEPLVGLGIVAGYVCRNINYAEDGDVSEHALGLALDVSLFEREGGEAVTVLEGWGSEAHGRLLREIYDDACGIFGTALGPESDAYHQDHFHLDAADRRRAYCPEDFDPANALEAHAGEKGPETAGEEEAASERTARANPPEERACTREAGGEPGVEE